MVIDEADLSLKDWVSSVVEGVAVDLTAPAVPTEAQGGSRVGLYLLELADAPVQRERRRATQQLRLRYLVTTWAATAEEEHRLLGELVFAALDREDMEVDLAPVPVAAWSAFGLPPRPAFVLQVPLARERRAAPVPRVREPLVMRVVPSVPLVGRVLGPGDIPLASALVELPGLALSTQTDLQGRFRFAQVPAEPPEKHLRVRAKGEVRSFTAELAPGTSDPVTIRFELQEA